MIHTFKNFLQQLNRPIKALLVLFIFSLSLGSVCTLIYQESPNFVINTKGVQQTLNSQQQKANHTLDEIKKLISDTSLQSLSKYRFEESNISYYLIKKGKVTFWTDNQIDMESIHLYDTINWHYQQLPNAHCIIRSIPVKSQYLISIIRIKNAYPYENDELSNSFDIDFNTNKQVGIVHGDKNDQDAIFSQEGTYLFTLQKPSQQIFSDTWAVLGFISFSIGFVLFFILYASFPGTTSHKTISLSNFIILSSSVGVVIATGLFFNHPSLLLSNKIFTAFQYSSTPLLSSISHLSVATAYLFATIYIFYFYVEIPIKNRFISGLILNLVFFIYFLMVYYLLSGLVYHSSIHINILHFKDITPIAIWIHFIILFWGIGLALLFYKSHGWLKNSGIKWFSISLDAFFTLVLFVSTRFFFPSVSTLITLSFFCFWLFLYIPYLFPKLNKIYGYVTVWSLVFTLFVVVNSIYQTNNKKNDKYKILAQNISINGNSENDRMADVFLEELDNQLRKDTRIRAILRQNDSLTTLNDYLNKAYLRGFWNKYEMRLNIAKPQSEIDDLYKNFIFNYGSQIEGTHFYSILSNENNLAYIGKYIVNTTKTDSLLYFMEFYPRSQFVSYSFPNLLIPTSPDIQSQLNIGIAKYEHRKLVYSSGKFSFPEKDSWIPRNYSEFFSFSHEKNMFYVYSSSPKSQIVITDIETSDPTTILLYLLYTFLGYLLINILIVWSYRLIKYKEDFRFGLTSKFQIAFILLLLLSFILIFYASVNYIQRKYQEEQIANLENKKNLIQKALQELYYWNQTLSDKNTQDLNFDLQDLSYLYHTDILVYNNNGLLVGSSQPRIFNKNLTSKRIAPEPFFSHDANINQYEHIGKLNYLTAYTDFYNGDFLQIGYIAIPQFLSQTEISNEINGFLAVVIQIYLIISILVILVSLFIGRQLSAPILVLENKLKEMRLGQRNEKVDYNVNDEIGQLVLQYNKTVDELEQSAKLLAKSERELAWKSMARQVAHEINNPLTPMKLTIQQLQRTKSLDKEKFDEYFSKSTSTLIEQIDNLSRIAGTFSNFARMPEASFERVDIASRLYSVVQLFIHNNHMVSIRYTGLVSGLFVFADPEQLMQVFNNLLKNALQAIPANRTGEIKVNITSLSKKIIIQFKDNGVGVEKDSYDKIFAPNFTTKSNGMGLGLAISKNIIEISGGKISFESQPNIETTFSIELPEA